ncbi:hypothetical protein HUU42_09320 [bacterium]|nr:hypothetical protein [bacterium]
MVALFVVLTFIFFIILDILITKAQKQTHPALSSVYNAPVFDRHSLVVPSEVFLSKGHTWAKVMRDGFVKVGIDGFIAKALGRLFVTHMVPIGTRVKQGDVIMLAWVGRSNLQFRSPVDGVVESVNPELTGVGLKNGYSKQWGVMIRPTNLMDNIRSLKYGQEMTDWMRTEFNRLKDFLGSHTPQVAMAGVTMQDGGTVMEGAVSMINDEGVKDFQNEFLTM